jgi:hypothetical protein
MDDYRSKLVTRHHACGLDYSVQALGGWALRTRYKVYGPSRNAVKIRKKSGKIPAKYGIPKIRSEKHHPRFRSDSENLRPAFRTVSGFFRKYGNGRVKCGKTDGSERKKFRPFSTLPKL